MNEIVSDRNFENALSCFEQITGTTFDPNFVKEGKDRDLNIFSFIYVLCNSLHLEKTQKQKIYRLWSGLAKSYLFDIYLPFELEVPFKLFCSQLGITASYIDNRINTNFCKKTIHCASATYSELENCDTFRTIAFLTDGEWKNSDVFDVQGKMHNGTSVFTPSDNIVGLDLEIENCKQVPQVCIIVGQTDSFARLGESNAQVSLMMLRTLTRYLRTLASNLYPLLRHVFDRKLIVDLIIYHLVRDAHRCSNAIFFEKCPNSVKDRFQHKVSIPFHISFQPDGYFFRPKITVQSSQNVRLIGWKNAKQKRLEQENSDWFIQMIQEQDEPTFIENTVQYCFGWRACRLALVIQSNKPIVKIVVDLKYNGGENYCCEDASKILLQKEKDTYWYSVSLMSTHDYYDAVVGNDFYNMRVMQALYPFQIERFMLKLYIEEDARDAKTIVYSRMLNRLMTSIESNIAGPQHSD